MALVDYAKMQRMQQLAKAMEQEERDEQAGDTEEEALGTFVHAFSEASRRSNEYDFEGAVAAWTEVIALDGSTAQVWQERGHARAALHQFAEAEADFSAALDRAENDEERASIYFSRGSARGDSGQEDGAIADFSAALRLEPDRIETWLCRGTASLSRGDASAASADAEAALSHDRESAAAWGLLGAARQRLGHFREAVEACQAALKLDPDLSWAKNCLQTSLAELEDGDVED